MCLNSKKRTADSMDQTTDDRECRLCFEGGGDLIAPCNCRGTSQWVHRSCLNRWRSMNHNPIAFTHCTECQFEYKLERVARTQSEMQRRFQLRVARDSTVVFKKALFCLRGQQACLVCPEANEKECKNCKLIKKVEEKIIIKLF